MRIKYLRFVVAPRPPHVLRFALQAVSLCLETIPNKVCKGVRLKARNIYIWERVSAVNGGSFLCRLYIYANDLKEEPEEPEEEEEDEMLGRIFESSRA